jgi:hypothetical protein
MGVRTRGLDIKAGAAKLKADRAARLEAELVIDRWNRRLATGRDMLWSPTFGLRWSPELRGWMSSVRGAAPAGRSTCERSTVIHWLRSARWCLGCGVRGVRDRRRCRSCWACTRCRARTAPAKGPLDAVGPINVVPAIPKRFDATGAAYPAFYERRPMAGSCRVSRSAKSPDGR